MAAVVAECDISRRRVRGAPRDERDLAMVILLAVGHVVFPVIAVYFRSADMPLALARGHEANESLRAANLKRRRFLRWSWTIGGPLRSFVRAWMAGSLPQAGGKHFDSRSALVDARPLDDFAPSPVTAFPAGEFDLSRLEAGGLFALHRVCARRGCAVSWPESRRCCERPCRRSGFVDRDRALDPSAMRSIDVLAVRVENGIVRVDPSRRIRRVAFRVSRVTRP